jgi:hypothetical protein
MLLPWYSDRVSNPAWPVTEMISRVGYFSWRFLLVPRLDDIKLDVDDNK